MKPFVVNVADLVKRPGARRRERVEARLTGPAVTVVDASLRTDVPVVVDTLLEWVSDGLLATGTVDGAWEGVCRRCLGPAGGELHVDFQELFESNPRDGESYRLGHDQIRLGRSGQHVIELGLGRAEIRIAGIDRGLRADEVRRCWARSNLVQLGCRGL